MEGEGGESDGSQLIKVVLDFWTAFDLDGRRSKLDNKALEMKDAREASARSRKALAESTKEFRRMNDSEKLATIKDLLKSYQDEIDALTKRARASDSAFLTLYKDLYEAPDPSEALKLSMTARPRAAQSQLEVQRLKAEIAEYEKEFKELKNQDITIRKLQEEIDEFEEQLEAKVQEQVKESKAAMDEEVEKRIEEMLEREVVLEKQLENAQAALQEAQSNTDRLQTRIFEITKEAEEAAAAAQAEIQILSESSEKHQSVSVSLEREVNLLRSRLDAAPGTAKDSTEETLSLLDRTKHLDAEVLELRMANGKLHKDVVNKERLLEETSRTLSEEVSSLKSELTEVSERNHALQTELSARPSSDEVNQLRRQLRTLQQLEFNVEDDSGDRSGSLSAVADAVDEASNPEDTSAVEKALMARLRKVESTSLALRRELNDVKEERDGLRSELEASKRQAQESAELVTRLEGDLLKQSKKPLSPTSSAPHAAQSDVSLASLMNADATTPASGPQDNDMLSIVQAQRDRFVQRIHELEEGNANLAKQISSQRQTNQQLQRDNVSLYERIRYLQNYPNRKPASLEEGGGDGGIEARYKSMYEAQQNPFTQFSQMEKQRRYAELSVAEKITLNTTRLFLSSKFARTFAFFYIVTLHCLCFLTMFHWAHTTSCTQSDQHQFHHSAGAPSGGMLEETLLHS